MYIGWIFWYIDYMMKKGNDMEQFRNLLIKTMVNKEFELILEGDFEAQERLKKLLLNNLTMEYSEYSNDELREAGEYHFNIDIDNDPIPEYNGSIEFDE